MDFADRIRERREEFTTGFRGPFSQRQVALRVGFQPAYLSKLERGLVPPPSEEKIVRLAAELDLDPDELLALAGKVASDLQGIIRERPPLFGRLIRGLKDAPDDHIRLLADRSEQGDW